MADAQDNGAAHEPASSAARQRIRDCEVKMDRYRAAIGAGGDPYGDHGRDLQLLNVVLTFEPAARTDTLSQT